MGLDRRSVSATHRGSRYAGAAGVSRVGRRVLSCAAHRLRLGAAAEVVPALVHGVQVLEPLGGKGRVRGMRDRLREQWRRRLDRHAQPSAAVLNAQSTRVLPQGGESGFDACKKVKGPQASLARRYAGLAAGGHCHGRQCARPRRRAGRGGVGLVSVPRTHLSSRREAANLVSRQSTNETRWAWIDSRWSAAWLMSALDGVEGQVPERS